MHGNLAETAQAALTAACAPGAGLDAALPAPRLGGDTTVVVADTCVRGALGFVPPDAVPRPDLP